jgi:hypothetical protein
MEANGVRLYAQSMLVEYLFHRSGNVFLGSQATVGVADVRLQSKASFSTQLIESRNLLAVRVGLQDSCVLLRQCDPEGWTTRPRFLCLRMQSLKHIPTAKITLRK